MLRRRDILLLRLGAIEALGEARTPQSMLALQKLLEDRESDVRESAARLFTRARRQTSRFSAGCRAVGPQSGKASGRIMSGETWVPVDMIL